VLRALLLGRTDALSPDLQEDFRSSGTVHVLAVSGLHVGFVVLIAMTVARCLGASPRGAMIAALPVLVAFAAVVGARPSVVRATAMAFALAASQRRR